MLEINSIRTIHAGMKADVEKAQALLASLDSSIQKIKADGSRHPNWIAEKIAELRAQKIPAIGAIIRTFDDRSAEVMADKPNWQNKPLLLSRQRFDKDPVSDATIRQSRLTECERMDAATLQIVADNAKGENNLPLFWCCFVTGLQRAGQPGWGGIDFANVVIPDQAEALQLIEQCSALTHLAHSCYSQASGNVLTGLDKMQVARATQSLQAA